MANDDIHEGGCLCGAVRYCAVEGESMTVTHCHCRMCRRATGGSFITWVEFQAKDFVYTKGQPGCFRSSDLSERTFCETCGCHLSFWDVGDQGGFAEDIWVALGGLDRPDDIQPTHHIFTNYQIPQLQMGDDLPRWPEQLPWLMLDGELPEPTVPDKNDCRPDCPTKMDGEAVEGGCLCGSVRYRAVADPDDMVEHCHCSMCRKSTGATLVSWVNAPRTDFAFIKGQPKTFSSSNGIERTFCGSCGCQFTMDATGVAGGNSGNIRVTLGSADRPEDLGPARQVFSDDRISWLRVT